MSDKQLTAVEWLNQQFVDRQNGNGDSRSWDEIISQAMEMEAMQREKDYSEGYDFGYEEARYEFDYGRE